MTGPAVEAAIADLRDILTGAGRHTGHQRRQIGRCVWCDCGARAQGRSVNIVPAGVPAWQVRLADGFVAYRGTRNDAETVAARHPGATTEPAR